MYVKTETVRVYIAYLCSKMSESFVPVGMNMRLIIQNDQNDL